MFKKHQQQQQKQQKIVSLTARLTRTIQYQLQKQQQYCQQRVTIIETIEIEA